MCVFNIVLKFGWFEGRGGGGVGICKLKCIFVCRLMVNFDLFFFELYFCFKELILINSIMIKYLVCKYWLWK